MRFGILLFVALALAAIASPIQGNASELSWHWASPSPTGDDLVGVTWGADRFVAVGESGTILTSRDAITWQECQSTTQEPIRSVSWNGTRFVCVGAHGLILTSTDGISWTRADSHLRTSLKAVASDGSKWVAVGAEGAIVTSPDGVTWQTQAPVCKNHLSSIIWDGTRFVVFGMDGMCISSQDAVSWKREDLGTTDHLVDASRGPEGVVVLGRRVGRLPTGASTEVMWNTLSGIIYYPKCIAASTNAYVVIGETGTVYRSPDGIAWQAYHVGFTSSTSRVCWGGNQFVAVGKRGRICTSPDGKNWTLRSSAELAVFGGIADSGKEVVVLSADSVARSTDLQNWQIHSVGSPMNAVCWMGDRFVAVGDKGEIRSSPDGRSWTKEESNTDRELLDVVARPGCVAIVGKEGILLTNTVGARWDLNTIPDGWAYKAIASDGRSFVAVGRSDWILRSEDGRSWKQLPLASNANLEDVTWDGHEFVAVGSEGTILTSPTGEVWTLRHSDPSLSLTRIAAGSGRWVAVGDNGVQLVSRDGLTWNKHQRRDGANFNAVARVRDRWVAADQTLRILVGPNGTDWQTVLSSTFAESEPLHACAWNGEQFVVVGPRTIASSPDGVTWARSFPPVGHGFTAVTWCAAAGRWVVLGVEGLILTSPNGRDWEPQKSPSQQHWRAAVSDGTQFVCVGNAGSIATSVDGIHWQPVESPTQEALLDIVWTGRQFVVSATGNIILTSPDGKSWRTFSVSTPSLLLRLAWTGNGFLAVGEDQAVYGSEDAAKWRRLLDRCGARAIASHQGKTVAVGGFGVIAESADLSQWTTHPAHGAYLLMDVCFGAKRFVAVGLGGHVLYSDAP